MEKVWWDMGRGWGCRGGWLGVRREGKDGKNMLFSRWLFQGHSPGGTTVWLHNAFWRSVHARTGSASNHNNKINIASCTLLIPHCIGYGLRVKFYFFTLSLIYQLNSYHIYLGLLFHTVPNNTIIFITYNGIDIMKNLQWSLLTIKHELYLLFNTKL